MENDKLLSDYGINGKATLTLTVTEADPTYSAGPRMLPYDEHVPWFRNLGWGRRGLVIADMLEENKA